MFRQTSGLIIVLNLYDMILIFKQYDNDRPAFLSQTADRLQQGSSWSSCSITISAETEQNSCFLLFVFLYRTAVRQVQAATSFRHSISAQIKLGYLIIPSPSVLLKAK